MNTLDIIILVCFLPAIVSGISKGFTAQVVALLGVLLGVWIAYRTSDLLTIYIQGYIQASPQVINIVSFVLIFIVVMLLVRLIGKLITSILKFAMLGWVDKLLGVGFALIKVGLLVGLVIMLFDIINTKLELVSVEKLSESVLYAPLKDLAYTVFPYFKELVFKK